MVPLLECVPTLAQRPAPQLCTPPGSVHTTVVPQVWEEEIMPLLTLGGCRGLVSFQQDLLTTRVWYTLQITLLTGGFSVKLNVGFWVCSVNQVGAVREHLVCRCQSWWEGVSAKMKSTGVYVMAQVKAYGGNIALKIIRVWKRDFFKILSCP